MNKNYIEMSDTVAVAQNASIAKLREDLDSHMVAYKHNVIAINDELKLRKKQYSAHTSVVARHQARITENARLLHAMDCSMVKIIEKIDRLEAHDARRYAEQVRLENSIIKLRRKLVLAFVLFLLLCIADLTFLTFLTFFLA